MKYLAIIEASASGHSVYFPDLPGCTSAGKTVEEAVSNAHEALAGHLEVSNTAGDVIPTPTLGLSSEAYEGEVARAMVSAAW